MRHQRKEYVFSPQLHQQSFPIVLELDQFQWDCEHNHVKQQTNHRGQPKMMKNMQCEITTKLL